MKIRWVYESEPDHWHQVREGASACGRPAPKRGGATHLPDDGIPCENCFRAILSRPDVGPLR